MATHDTAPTRPAPSVEEAQRQRRILTSFGQAAKGRALVRQAMTDALRAEREARRG